MADYPHVYKDVDKLLKNEFPPEKVWSNPRDMQWALTKNPDYPDHEWQKVSIDDLLKNVDYSTLENNKETWEVNGIFDPKMFKYDSKKDNNKSHMINATRKKDGSYVINDGRHRLIALKNDGYTHAVIPIYDEFINQNPYYKDYYQNVRRDGTKLRNSQLKYGVKFGLLDEKEIPEFKRKIKNKVLREKEIDNIKKYGGHYY